ncbi:hypothetical protein COT98_01170 [Candidatus Falkowbacteria bacterium CG10_big_fil_rev_8_21_14_0_10_39_9]|uniref:Uncharacterized protein n=1 Tax=Candidatus Falkowbacteria bacterium CG10_big_fil_rev_8_21_14_0_10_39_9 TaxID=1974566 RepID=A0A2M6WQQ1_9BACT|nr:MAG: hypothetical protein COT98_01170 [Candidatus Falkowbacteria bacterium CG10_big_fil_rev_8_21_14_0_10_39_9]
MQIIPSAPTPVDGSCAFDNHYYYESTSPDTYTISYCLGNQTGTLAAGNKCATPGGVMEDYCGNVCEYNSCHWQFLGDENVSDSAALFTSLAVHDGTPYVAYTDSSAGDKLSVKKFNGADWVAVGSLGFSDGATFGGPVIALDDGGNPYVFYGDVAHSNRGVVQKFDGASWVDVGTIPISVGNVYYLNLKIYFNVPYILYYDTSVGTLIKKFDGANWVDVGTSPVGTDTAESLSLDIYNGDIYIAYDDWNDPGNYIEEEKLRKFNGTTWDLVGDTNANTSYRAQQTALVINNGTPYIAYNLNPYVIKYENGVWSSVGTLLTSGNVPDLNIFTNHKDIFVSFQGYWGQGYYAVVTKYTGGGPTGWEPVGAAFGWPPPYVGNYASLSSVTSLKSLMSDNVIYVSYVNTETNRVSVRRFDL